MTAGERRTAVLLATVILGLHVLGLVALLAGPLAAGIGATAYTLGLRHAFDADHIGAIDNVTRKLTADGRRPLSTGFWFSLGHATVVFAAAALVAAGVRVLGARGVGGVVGPTVSGTFLLVIGVLNLRLLVERVRDGADVPAGGVLGRCLSRATRAVRAPWQMYPLGLLFGLGFDTATEITLLATAGTAAAGGLPFWSILSLPLLFAAGMSLLDTLDGALMGFAYGWRTAAPARKRVYDVCVTGLSVAVALLVGAAELLSALGVAEVDVGVVGYAVVGLFALAWTVAVAASRPAG